MASSTEILKKRKQFRGLWKNRVLLVRLLYFKLCFQKEFSPLLTQCRVSLLMMVNGCRKIGSVHYYHCVQKWETLQIHNLKKSFCILDYALRVFSKAFPLYEILLNISTLHKIAVKRSSLYKAHTELIKATKLVKIERNCLPFFENLLWFNSFECKAFFTKHVELIRRNLSSVSIEITQEVLVFSKKNFKVLLKEVNLRFI